MKLKYALLLSAISLTLTACGGSSNDNPKPPIVVADTTPDSFSFSAIENAPLNKWVESAPVTITGINTDTPISIENGEYSIDGGDYTAAQGTITSGKSVKVRVKSSNLRITAVEAKVSVGDATAIFKVKTEARIAFIGWDHNFGNELRATDLSNNNAELVVDINTEPAEILKGEKIKSPVLIGDNVFFCRGVVGSLYSDSVYTYNEKTAQTTRLGSIETLTQGEPSDCVELFELDEKLYLVTENQQANRYLWQLDSTNLNKLTKLRTYPVNYVRVDPSTGIADSFEFHRYGNLLLKKSKYFMDIGGYYSYTYKVENLFDDSIYQTFNSDFLGARNGLLYFYNRNGEGGHWQTDGTDSGTIEITEQAYNIIFEKVNESSYVNNGIFSCNTNNFDYYVVPISGYDEYGYADLYSYNKNNKGNTYLISRVIASSVKCNNQYAVAKQIKRTDEISVWRSEGAVQNTYTLKSISSGDLNIYESADALYVHHDNGELSVIDETAERLNPILNSPTILEVFPLSNYFYFNGYSDDQGVELWAADSSSLNATQITSDGFSPEGTGGTKDFKFYGSTSLSNGVVALLDDKSVYAIAPGKENQVNQFAVSNDYTWAVDSPITRKKPVSTTKYAYYETWGYDCCGARTYIYYRTDGVSNEIVLNPDESTGYQGEADMAAINTSLLLIDRHSKFYLYDDASSLDEKISSQVPDKSYDSDFVYERTYLLGTTSQYFYVHKKLIGTNSSSEGSGDEQRIYQINLKGEVKEVFQSNIAVDDITYLQSGNGRIYFSNPTEHGVEVWLYSENSDSLQKLFKLESTLSAEAPKFYDLDDQLYMVVPGNDEVAGLYRYDVDTKEVTRISNQTLLEHVIKAEDYAYVLGSQGIWLLKDGSLQLLADKELLLESKFEITSTSNALMVDNQLVFEANHNLWITDGTLQGTSTLNNQLSVNSQLYLLP